MRKRRNKIMKNKDKIIPCCFSEVNEKEQNITKMY